MLPSFNGLLHGGIIMSMNIRQADAVNGAGYASSSTRGKSKSLESLSTGFRIDNGPRNGAVSTTSREPVSRQNLERAVRTASQSAYVQSVSQNSYNERNADLVRQRAQGDNAPPASGGGGNGQIDAYA